jgi:hypothetical protein
MISAVLACVCAVTIGYADQGQRPGSAPRPRPVPGSNRDSKESSTSAVTGCVKPGTEPKTYLLMETLSVLTPEGAAPKPAAIRDGGSKYQLFTDGTIDLAKLVGREVHANGTVSKPAVSSDPAKATTLVDAIPKFTVKTLTETGSSC